MAEDLKYVIPLGHYIQTTNEISQVAPHSAIQTNLPFEVLSMNPADNHREPIDQGGME